ncbi:hypothetical protein N7508_005962 [Penicillium antarcticum]|nr:uncharacterized protein N7508_005962 [Penicillium antarcticum]KAJ5306947.1 hypothetical protein N7508_005962 [Penicillium antarcticum]
MDSNQTYPTVTGPLSSTETAMLEVLVPGYGFISRILMSYLNIDINAYIQLVVAMAVFGASFRYVYNQVSTYFSQYFVSRAEIRLDDEIFNYLMYWISRQSHMKQTNRFVAGIKSNGYWSDDEDSDAGDQDDDWDKLGDDGKPASFDDCWAKVLSRDKYKTLRFTPAQGSHYFWYRNRPIMLERLRQEGSARWVLNNERLYLSCLGRDPTILKTLLAEAQQAYVERDGNLTVIYRGQRACATSPYDWYRGMARLPRPLSTVILDQEQKQSFINDIKEYLHPRTRRWYSNRGIPYRRGYLFHGPPGTGKTSLCFAAAGLLGLKLYLLNLNSTALDEDGLASLFAALPRRCIVLLEDIDAAGITSTRGKTIISTPEPTIDETIPSEGDGDADATVVPETPAKGGVTLSGLLNVIDGVAASEGRILVMTTNHADKLDPALLRPGRVDMTINFGYTSEADIREMFISIYNTTKNDIRRGKRPRTASNGSAKSSAKSTAEERRNFEDPQLGDEKDLLQDALQPLQSRISRLADEFAAIVPSGELTAAEIQGYLLNHKEIPEAAIRSAPEWAQSTLEKKRAREEKDKFS